MVRSNGATIAPRSKSKLEPKEEKRVLTINPFNLETMAVRVIGLTAVIVHAFAEKGRKQMLGDMMRDPSKPKAKRDAKDPFEDFKGSLYVLPGAKLPEKKLQTGQHWPFLKDTFGVPAIGFKKGMVFAAQRYGMNRMDAEAAVIVLGDLVPLTYEKLIMREDVVKVGPWNRRVADLRYRGMFTGWSAEFVVEYDADIITPETIMNLVNRAGRVSGMCEWRPSCKDNPGTFGRYEVELGKR